MKYFWRAIRFASENKFLTIFTVFLTLLQTGLDAMIPQIIKRFFDLVQTHFSTGATTIDQSFWRYIIIFAILLLAVDIVNQTKNYFITKWWGETRKALSAKVFKHLQSLSIRYFEVNSPGRIKERVDKGINDLNSILEGTFMEILPQALYVIVAVYFLFRVNLLFGLVIVIGIPLFALISLAFSKKIINIEDDLRNSEEMVSTVAIETILNIRTVKSFSAEKRHYNKFTDQLKESVRLTIRYILTRINMNILRFLIIDSARIIILAFGAYWALTGRITVGTLALAWAYTDRSFGPMWHMTWLVDNMQKNMRSVRRVFELLDTSPAITDLPRAKNIVIKKGEIKMDNIYFKYPDRNVINGIDLTIRPGQVVAIVGRSGAGKSTIIKLLLRFVSLSKGRILIDGVNIDSVTQKSLRENVGVVQQESALFNDTVFNNIAYGRPQASAEEVIKAAEVANADSFIRALDNGYQTFIGERGVKLSGGEQQRINIARAILKNAPILVLDEATSSLDSENEMLIQDALNKLMKEKTTIIIAHRLSTIMNADLIVVLDKGKIIEQDTHEELVKSEGLYAKLYEIQSGGYLG